MALLLFTGQESATKNATAFMDALARRDAKAIVAVSLVPEGQEERVLQEWQAAFEAAKHYRFRWWFTHESQAGPDQVSVNGRIERNYNPGSSYDESLQVPMKKVDGKWKVDYASLSRQTFPFMPR